jgi:hypothetical protein
MIYEQLTQCGLVHPALQSKFELARSVYFTNDKHSDVKRSINLKLGSNFIEEKSYEEYS